MVSIVVRLIALASILGLLAWIVPFPGSETPRAISEIPMAHHEGRLLVPVELAGIGERYFLLDTAAGASVVSPRVRSALNPGPDEVRMERVIGATGAGELETVRIASLRFGSGTHVGVWALVADLPDFREFEGLAVEGILGVDVLGSYDVMIDVPGAVLVLYPQDGGAASAFGKAAATIPFRSDLQQGLVQFTPRINGTQVEAILDTGAEHGTLNWPAAELVGIRPGGDTASWYAAGVGGEFLSIESHAVDDLCVGAYCWTKSTMHISDLPFFQAAGYAERPAMLFGANLLAECPLLIAYSSRILHFCTDPTRP